MKKLTFLLTLCLWLAILAGCTSATPILPTATMLPPTATVEGSAPSPAWTFTAGAAIRSPVAVADGVVYFGSEDHNIYAVAITAHDLKWKYKTGGAVRSQPTVSKDRVYAASDDSYLYAVAKSDGSLSWKSQVEKEAVTRISVGLSDPDLFTSSPVLQDTSLYIGSTDGNLYALDAATGKTLWKYAAINNSSIRTTPLVADGVVYFGDVTGNFYAVNAKEGTKVWGYAGSDHNFANGMALNDNVLYFVSSKGIHALDAKTGHEKWRTPYDNLGGYACLVPAYENDIFYADGQTSFIGAYGAQLGNLMWDVYTPPDLFSSCIGSPAVGQNKIYVGCDGEGLYAVDKHFGGIEWMLTVASATGIGVNASPTVADGVVYFGGMDGKLYAVKDQ